MALSGRCRCLPPCPSATLPALLAPAPWIGTPSPCTLVSKLRAIYHVCFLKGKTKATGTQPKASHFPHREKTGVPECF